MPEFVRYFEKSPDRPGTYVEVTREYNADGLKNVIRGKFYRLARDEEFGGEVTCVPDMHTPVRLLPA